MTSNETAPNETAPDETALTEPALAEPALSRTGNPGALVSAATARCLEQAATWIAWDGRPIVTDGAHLWTPHKALRRITDHLIDHLAEVEALLADTPTIPDHWHGRMVTL